MISYYKNSLLQMFVLLNEIKSNPFVNIEDSYRLQMRILKSIRYVEKRIWLQKGIVDNLKTKFIKCKSEEAKRHNLGTSNEIKNREESIIEYKHIIHILKCIGDGLAFIYINKYDIKPMSFKQASGFLSGKKGLKSELRFLRLVYKSGQIALLNDITNCLRYGDITVPNDGTPHIFEIKTKKNFNKRIKRQEDGINAIIEYLETDITDKVYNITTSEIGKLHEIHEMRRESITYPEETNVEFLNEVINTAYEKRSCFKEIEAGIFYSVDFYDNIEELNLIENIKLIKRPLVYFLNDMKYESAGYYPFTLSISNPERLFDFYCGTMLIMVFVDLEVIKNKFLAHGINFIVKQHFDEDEFPFLVADIENIELKDNYIQTSRHFFSRIAYEFISLNWFINELVYKMKKLNETTKQEVKSKSI